MTNETNKTIPRRRRPLYRDTDDSMVAGVCSGLGHYFDMDTTLVRVALVVITVLGVFVLPLLGIGGKELPALSLAVGALLLVGHSFAIAGHYGLYNRKAFKNPKWFPVQERIAIALVMLAVLAFLAAALR